METVAFDLPKHYPPGGVFNEVNLKSQIKEIFYSS